MGKGDTVIFSIEDILKGTFNLDNTVFKTVSLSLDTIENTSYSKTYLTFKRKKIKHRDQDCLLLVMSDVTTLHSLQKE